MFRKEKEIRLTEENEKYIIRLKRKAEIIICLYFIYKRSKENE